MKFLCDRCKTRYSIGDDRVRGKILKIRCKNCANVITVREGMADESDGVVARRGQPTTGAPQPMSTSPGGGTALGAAFANQMTKPPAALEEEWYVSNDGDQQGPYSLADAQRWVAGKPIDAELHCWSEGFDDWLPVDKVSHFRGLRKKPQPVAPVAPRRIQPVEDEPKPLFAATMAQLEKSAPAALPAMASAPTAKATPAAKTNGAGVIAGVQARSGPVPAAIAPPIPSLAPKKPAGKTGAGTGPARAQTAQGVGNPLSPGAKALATAFDVKDDPADSMTAVEAPIFRDEVPTAAEPVASQRLDSLGDAAVTIPTGPKASAMAKQAWAPPPVQPRPLPMSPELDEDNLEIGEVSRVVKLADLAKMGPSPQRKSRPPLGRTAPVPKLDPGAPGAMLGAPMPGDPLMAGEPAAGESLTAAPVVAQAHRRGLILLGVAVIVLLGAVGAVVFFVTGGGADDLPLGLGHATQIDTSRPEDIIHPKNDPGPGSATPIKPPPHHWVNTNPGHPGGAETPEILDPTKQTRRADDVEELVRKQQGGIDRCYMRAQKGALGIELGDLKKIAVTMTIDKEGAVTDVELSEHGADALGKCLISRVKGIRFPAASGTGQFRIVLAAPAG